MDLAVLCYWDVFQEKRKENGLCGGWWGLERERRSLINTVKFYRTASHPWTATLSALLPLSSAAPGSRSWLLARCCGDGPTLGDERQLPIQHHVTASGTKHGRSSNKPNWVSARFHTQANKHTPQSNSSEPSVPRLIVTS